LGQNGPAAGYQSKLEWSLICGSEQKEQCAPDQQGKQNAKGDANDPMPMLCRPDLFRVNGRLRCSDTQHEEKIAHDRCLSV
jgi:hypothetical protein